MSYRIRVESEAGETLRTLRAHVVQRVGRLLAELAAELAAVAQPGREGTSVSLLEVDDCVLCYEVDRARRTVSLLSVRSALDSANELAAQALATPAFAASPA